MIARTLPKPGTEEKRIIRIDFSGGTEEGDFRFGPLNYTHPEAEGIVSTVSNLIHLLHIMQNYVDPKVKKFLYLMPKAGVLLLSMMDYVLHATGSRRKAPTFFIVKKQV